VLALGEVDADQTLMAVVHVPDALSDLPETDRLFGEGLAQEEIPALELDAAVLPDAPNFKVRVVLN